jgi:hypothetical protein
MNVLNEEAQPLLVEEKSLHKGNHEIYIGM